MTKAAEQPRAASLPESNWMQGWLWKQGCERPMQSHGSQLAAAVRHQPRVASGVQPVQAACDRGQRR